MWYFLFNNAKGSAEKRQGWNKIEIDYEFNEKRHVVCFEFLEGTVPVDNNDGVSHLISLDCAFHWSTGISMQARYEDMAELK